MDKQNASVAVALLSLAAYCKRLANRKALKKGAQSHRVDLFVSGKACGKSIEFPVCGSLTIEKDNPTGSTESPSMVDVVAWLLGEIPRDQHGRVAKRLRTLVKTNKLNTPPSDLKAIAEQTLDSLKRKKKKAGAVSFVDANPTSPAVAVVAAGKRAA